MFLEKSVFIYLNNQYFNSNITLLIYPQLNLIPYFLYLIYHLNFMEISNIMLYY